MEFNDSKILNNDVIYIKTCEKKRDVILSIVIPTYRRGKMLEESIESVINQVSNNENVELIVLSNDPDDDLEAINNKFQTYDFSIIKNRENIGMVGNINRCIDVANGAYIAYLHDDDMVTCDYVETVLYYIKNYSYIDCFIPARYVLTGDNDWGKRMQKKQFAKHVISIILSPFSKKENSLFMLTIDDVIKTGRNCFNAPTCGTVFKKNKLIEIGRFPKEWKYAFDLVMYEKFCKINKVAIITKPLGVYRMVESASNNDVVQLEFFDALKFVIENNFNSGVVNSYYYEYLHLFYMGLSEGARILINEKYGALMTKWKKLKYLKLRLKTIFFYHSSGIEAERYLGKKLKKQILGR